MLHALLWASLASADPLVTGLVLDESGSPVEGAIIDNERIYGTSRSQRNDVLSGADGRFEVPWPTEHGTENKYDVTAARIQARTPTGSTSEALYPTSFPAELTLQLRPPPRVEVVLAGTVPADVTVRAVVMRDSPYGNSGVQVHDGPMAVEGDGFLLDNALPGQLELMVISGGQMATAHARLKPGETTRLTLQLLPHGDLSVTLPHTGERLYCIFTPGTSYDASRGFPVTAADCSDLEPTDRRYTDWVAGEQRVTIKGDFGEVQRRLFVRPGHWCNWELDLEPGPTGGKVGIALPTDASAATVISVVEGSPAAVAGLGAGDTLTHVGTTAVRTGLEAFIEIGKASPDTAVKITYQRGGKKRVARPVKTAVAQVPLVLPSECGERPVKPDPPYRRPYGLPVKEVPRDPRQ